MLKQLQNSVSSNELFEGFTFLSKTYKVYHFLIFIRILHLSRYIHAYGHLNNFIESFNSQVLLQIINFSRIIISILMITQLISTLWCVNSIELKQFTADMIYDYWVSKGKSQLAFDEFHYFGHYLDDINQPRQNILKWDYLITLTITSVGYGDGISMPNLYEY